MNNNYPSDEEVRKQYNSIHPLEMSLFNVYRKVTEHKTYRDELFYKLLNGWNIERVKNGYKPLTAKRLASAINSNPFLKSDDGELSYLIDRCVKAGNYKTASWILFPKKK